MHSICLLYTSHAIKNKKKIKSTLFAYAYGTLRQNLQQFGNRPESPTIHSVSAITMEFTAKRTVVIQQKHVSQEQEKQREKEEETVRENKAYIASLDDTAKRIAEQVMVQIGNPLNLPFIPDALAIKAAFAEENLRNRIEERTELLYQPSK